VLFDTGLIPSYDEHKGKPIERSFMSEKRVFEAEDIEKNKILSALAYLLFFVPLLAAPESKFGKFHANQGLLNLILAIAGGIILGFIPVLGWMLLPLFNLGILALDIWGAYNAYSGKAIEMPVYGNIEIIK
jgi:uncharacterized membrane protein